MLKSSVLKIFRTFTKEEIIEFNDFLNSPYHNKKSGVVKLFNEIKKYHPDFTNGELEYETLWNKLYPEKNYGYGVMKNLIFDITKLAEEFIALQDYHSDNLQEMENLFKAMSKRKLNSLIENKSSYFTKKFSDEALKMTTLSVERFYGLLSSIHETRIISRYFQNVFADMRNDIIDWQDVFVTGMLIQLINLNDTSNNLTLYSNEYSKSKQLTRIILDSIPDELFNKVLKNIKERSSVKYTLLNCYFLAGKAITSNTDSGDYFKIKKFFFRNFNLLPKACREDIVDFLVNSVELSTDISLDKRNEMYDLYQFRHRNNLFTDKYGQINSSYYVPHLTLFLQQGTTEDLIEFISCYSEHIIDNEKESCLLFAEALRFFMSSEFENSLSVILKVKFNTFSLKNILKKFTMILYYELNNYEDFKFSYDSHLHFLKYGDWDKKDPGYKFIITKTKLFCDRIDKLFKLSESKNIFEIEIFEKLFLANNLDYKRWFLNKIEELRCNTEHLSA